MGGSRDFLKSNQLSPSKERCHYKCENGLPEQGDHVAVFSDVKRCAD